MSELISAIDDIERVLIGNKDRGVEKVYLKNAIRFIENHLNPQLDEDQVVVLHWLKDKYITTDIKPIQLFWRLQVNATQGRFVNRVVYKTYRNMPNFKQLEVLQAFSHWAIEQEEAE